MIVIGAALRLAGQTLWCSGAQAPSSWRTKSWNRPGASLCTIRATVAERIGKFARPKRMIWADDLPKTRSGKIMRRLLRDIAEGRELGDVTTLRDPAVTGQLKERVAELQAQED